MSCCIFCNGYLNLPGFNVIFNVMLTTVYYQLLSIKFGQYMYYDNLLIV